MHIRSSQIFQLPKSFKQEKKSVQLAGQAQTEKKAQVNKIAQSVRQVVQKAQASALFKVGIAALGMGIGGAVAYRSSSTFASGVDSTLNKLSNLFGFNMPSSPETKTSSPKSTGICSLDDAHGISSLSCKPFFSKNPQSPVKQAPTIKQKSCEVFSVTLPQCLEKEALSVKAKTAPAASYQSSSLHKAPSNTSKACELVSTFFSPGFSTLLAARSLSPQNVCCLDPILNICDAN